MLINPMDLGANSVHLLNFWSVNGDFTKFPKLGARFRGEIVDFDTRHPAKRLRSVQNVYMCAKSHQKRIFVSKLTNYLTSNTTKNINLIYCTKFAKLSARFRGEIVVLDI